MSLRVRAEDRVQTLGLKVEGFSGRDVPCKGPDEQLVACVCDRLGWRRNPRRRRFPSFFLFLTCHHIDGSRVWSPNVRLLHELCHVGVNCGSYLLQVIRQEGMEATQNFCCIIRTGEVTSVAFNQDGNIATKVHGLNLLLVLNLEGLCEVMLDGNTPCLHSLSSHTSHKLFAVAPHLKQMHLETLQLCKTVSPKFLEPTLMHHLMAPLANLSPLLVVLLCHAKGTLCCIRIQGATSGARGEGREMKKFD